MRPRTAAGLVLLVLLLLLLLVTTCASASASSSPPVAPTQQSRFREWLRGLVSYDPHRPPRRPTQCAAEERAPGPTSPTIPTLVRLFGSQSSTIIGQAGVGPYLYNFSEGTTGTCIVDGGDDMYDCGNQISVQATNFGYSGILSYRQSPESFLAGSGDVTYTTYKSSAYPFVWLAVFDSASDGIEGFRVTGNNGADGSGAASWGALGVSSVNPNFYGWYKKVYGAGDPSINHLVIAKGSSNWTQSADSSTDSDQHTLQKSGEEKTTRLYYLLFAGRYGHDFEPNSFGSVMDAFLDACEVDHGTIPA